VDAASTKVNGKTLNPEGLYHVTINRFLAEDDDKFSVFENGTQSIGGSDLEIIIVYLKEYPLIPLRLGGRISLSP
jgi:hypothetical protein